MVPIPRMLSNFALILTCLTSLYDTMPSAKRASSRPRAASQVRNQRQKVDNNDHPFRARRKSVAESQPTLQKPPAESHAPSIRKLEAVTIPRKPKGKNEKIGTQNQPLVLSPPTSTPPSPEADCIVLAARPLVREPDLAQLLAEEQEQEQRRRRASQMPVQGARTSMTAPTSSCRPGLHNDADSIRRRTAYLFPRRPFDPNKTEKAIREEIITEREWLLQVAIDQGMLAKITKGPTTSFKAKKMEASQHLSLALELDVHWLVCRECGELFENINSVRDHFKVVHNISYGEPRKTTDREGRDVWRLVRNVDRGYCVRYTDLSNKDTRGFVGLRCMFCQWVATNGLDLGAHLRLKHGRYQVDDFLVDLDLSGPLPVEYWRVNYLKIR